MNEDLIRAEIKALTYTLTDLSHERLTLKAQLAVVEDQWQALWQRKDQLERLVTPVKVLPPRVPREKSAPVKEENVVDAFLNLSPERLEEVLARLQEKLRK